MMSQVAPEFGDDELVAVNLAWPNIELLLRQPPDWKELRFKMARVSHWRLQAKSTAASPQLSHDGLLQRKGETWSLDIAFTEMVLEIDAAGVVVDYPECSETHQEVTWEFLRHAGWQPLDEDAVRGLARFEGHLLAVAWGVLGDLSVLTQLANGAQLLIDFNWVTRYSMDLRIEGGHRGEQQRDMYRLIAREGAASLLVETSGASVSMVVEAGNVAVWQLQTPDSVRLIL